MKAKIVLRKLRVFVKELFNLLTDCAVPLLSVLCALASVLQFPAKAILALKKAERWCYFACGTRDEIETIVNIIDGVVDEAAEENK